MKKILLIDSATEVQSQINQQLGARFEIQVASSYAEAQQIIAKEVLDAIVMETEFSDGSGFGLCKDIKNNDILKMLPVIFLTSRTHLADRIEGFKAGADDYVTKPFDSMELGLRIDARLRQSAKDFEQESTLVKEQLTLSIPYQKATVSEDGTARDMKLTPTEFRLLYFFIKNEGEILTRDQLLATVWNGDMQVLTRTIDKHISTLKKKLGRRASFIQSIHSRGYRFSVTNFISAEAPVPEAQLSS